MSHPAPASPRSAAPHPSDSPPLGAKGTPLRSHGMVSTSGKEMGDVSRVCVKGLAFVEDAWSVRDDCFVKMFEDDLNVFNIIFFK